MFNKSALRIIGIYLVGGYGVIEFVDFIVNHYMLSRNLIDVSIITLLSMIPSVVIVAYFESRSKWSRLGKISIPANFIVTLVFLFALFNDKELGATTTTITVEDEDGQRIERIIPKSEFRKEAMIFFFHKKSGDEKLDWLQYGMAAMLDLDLSQDMFLDITMPYGYTSEMKEAGFEKGIGMPLTLQRKFADDDHYEYFVTGEFVEENGEFEVHTFLYETKRTKLLAKNSFKGRDIFELVDEISVQVKRDLEVPVWHIDEMTDLPVVEITTTSLYAFELAMVGFNAMIFDDDYQKCIDQFEKAVEEDPAFAYVYGHLSELYLMANMSEKREKTQELMMKYLYKFPETEQYPIKAQYHELKGNSKKQLTVLKMWADLYPDDTDPLDYLADYYWRKSQYDNVIKMYKQILEIDPGERWCILWIGRSYREMGQYEEALKYFKQYAKFFPDETHSFTFIGDLYKIQGDLANAKSWYEKALAIKSESTSILVGLANIESISGDFEEAFKIYDEALAVCKTPREKGKVFSKLTSLYKLRGEMNKSLENLQLKFDQMEIGAPRLQLLAYTLSHLDIYVQAGKKDEAFKIIENIAEELQPPYDGLIPIGYFGIYLNLEDGEKAGIALKAFEKAYNTGEMPFVDVEEMNSLNAYVDELKGEYAEAISKLKEQVKILPTDATFKYDIGRCCRLNKEYDEAEEYLKKCLAILPFYPSAHYEIALVYSELGDQDKAVEHMNIALDIWKDADLIFEDAQLAKAKLEEWVN